MSEDDREYYAYIRDQLTDHPEVDQVGYSDHIKRPTLQQIKSVILLLNEQQPNWGGPPVPGNFYNTVEYVFQALIQQYPELRKKGGADAHITDVWDEQGNIVPHPDSKAAMGASQSGGCMVLMVLGLGLLSGAGVMLLA